MAVKDDDRVFEKHKLFGSGGVDKGPVEGLGNAHELSVSKNGGNGAKECEAFGMPKAQVAFGSRGPSTYPLFRF